MNDIKALFSNYVLNVSLISWLSAQVLKTLFNYAKTKKFNPERLVGAGGMPSAHSASVCGLTIAIARSQGFASPLFAVCFLLAAIVMYDAMGVRRQAGEHARVINMIVRKNKNYVTYMPKDKNGLKEFLGHTPLEVMAGAMLGILTAMLVPIGT